MALTSSEVQTLIDDLKRAIFRGQLEIQHNGQRVRYASIEEMRAALRAAESELAALGNTSQTRRRVVAVSRGI